MEIQYSDHAQGEEQVLALFRVFALTLLRNSEGWAIEEITRLGTHSVTHVDAPWHYNSEIQGQPSPTIDELPLEWFFSDGFVVDVSDKMDGDKIDAHDFRAALDRMDYEIKPLDIVLVPASRPRPILWRA